MEREEILKVCESIGLDPENPFYGRDIIVFARAVAAHEREEILMTVLEQARAAKPFSRLAHVLEYLLIHIRARGNK